MSVHKQTEQAAAAAASAQAQPAGQHLPARYLLAGFLAGASGLIALLLVLVLLLAIGAFWPLLHEISAGLRGTLPFWGTLGQSAAENLVNLPMFFWSMRWGILAMGLLGLLLALVDRRAVRIERPWSHLLSLVVLLELLGTIVFALQYTNRENLLAWMAVQPHLISYRESTLVSDTAALIIGAVVALPATYVVWAVWHWWYVRWLRWLRLEQRSAPVVEAVAAQPDDWRAYQLRLHRTKRRVVEEQHSSEPQVRPASSNARLLRFLVTLLVAMVIVLLGGVHLYNRSGSQLASDDLWVSQASPEALATLLFTRPPQQLIAAGISGEGLVDITFGQAQSTTSLRQIAGMQLIGFKQNYPSESVDLAGLEPGRYWVKAHLREGGGGQVRYTLLQGGGGLAQLAAWLIGLAAGSALALGLLAALEALALRGWGRPRSLQQG